MMLFSCKVRSLVYVSQYVDLELLPDSSNNADQLKYDLVLLNILIHPASVLCDSNVLLQCFVIAMLLYCS